MCRVRHVPAHADLGNVGHSPSITIPCPSGDLRISIRRDGEHGNVVPAFALRIAVTHAAR
jgi:hypothetical protein